MNMMRIRQVVNLLATHPSLFFSCCYRPHRFMHFSEESMPPDFHIKHTQLCLKRSINRFQKIYEEDSHFQSKSLLERETASFPCGRKSWLYILVRLLKPSSLIETGVWFGFSTSQILQGLSDNQTGKLYSVDAPNTHYDTNLGSHSDFLPNGMEPGFVIPPKLLKRWELTRGYSKDVLPELLARVGQVDFFFHDSEHTYANMMFEFRCAWKHMTEGAVLCSDDVDWNEAFLDFCKEVGCEGVMAAGIGIVMKGTH